MVRGKRIWANLTTFSVPDKLLGVGDFSEEIASTVIYDPSIALVKGTRTPFPGNVIPANQLACAGCHERAVGNSPFTAFRLAATNRDTFWQSSARWTSSPPH
jgi:hypothetical protein